MTDQQLIDQYLTDEKNLYMMEMYCGLPMTHTCDWENNTVTLRGSKRQITWVLDELIKNIKASEHWQ